jgi:hypothetical protein
MTFSKFTFKVSHDKGTVKISTVATSEETARQMIMKAEGCPARALKLVKSKPIITN